MFAFSCSLGDGEDAGRMYMMMGTPEATHRLQVRVKDNQANIVTNINVKVVYIDDDLVRNSASIRLSGKCEVSKMNDMYCTYK